MKSERAKQFIKTQSPGDIAQYEVSLWKAKKAVEIAEENARGRAKNAFCRSKCLIAETCIKHAYYVCGELEKFLKTYDEQ